MSRELERRKSIDLSASLRKPSFRTAVVFENSRCIEKSGCDDIRARDMTVECLHGFLVTSHHGSASVNDYIQFVGAGDTILVDI